MNITTVQYTGNKLDAFTAGKTAVVIDVFRASSVITTALAHKAGEIIVTSTIDEALSELRRRKAENCILGGERKMKKINGFDRDNSPYSYMNNVENKTIILTTTNGTCTIHSCRSADRIYIASLLNAEYSAEFIAKQKQDTVLVCAGLRGSFSLEDAFCAGKIMHDLSRRIHIKLDDFSFCLKHIYEKNKNNIKKFLSNGTALSALKSSGFEKDLDFCLQTDIYHIIPEYESIENKITASNLTGYRKCTANI